MILLHFLYCIFLKDSWFSPNWLEFFSVQVKINSKCYLLFFFLSLQDHFLAWLLTYFAAFEVLHTGEPQHGAAAARERRTASLRMLCHAGAGCWAPGLASDNSGSIAWRCFPANTMCFLKRSAWPAPQQLLQLWGLWLRRKGCRKGTAAGGKAASATRGGRDRWRVISNGVGNSRGKILLECCITASVLWGRTTGI